jgi:DNA repair exonuclease SbcCD ATPase subunit
MVELIEDNLDKIDEILKDIKNAIDISSIYDNPIYDETKNYIINLSKENREVYNKKLKDLINARRDEIRTESDKAKKEAQNLIDSLKKDVEEDIKQIEETIDDIDSIEAVEQIKENDPLVLKIKEKLAELPSSDAQKLDLTLDRIFSERIFKLRL